MTDETGQVAADSTGTTDDTPTDSVASSQTTDPGLDNAATEQSFFDPSDLPEELLPAYKQMQGAFTKRMQAASANRHKVDAYDAFERDPLGTIRQLATQYGYDLSQPSQQQTTEDPDTWEDVYAKATEHVMKQLNPLISEVQQTKKANIETYLDIHHPDWRQYEDAMTEIVNKHPSLATDPDTLYKMSVPSEVLEARAAKRAMSKLQNKVDSSKVSGQSTTAKEVSGKPKGKMTIQEAADYARANMKLA